MNMKKEEFINKKIYITGATGLIGSNLVNELLKVNGIDIILQVRNEEKAKKLFGKRVKYEVCDLLDTPKCIK